MAIGSGLGGSIGIAPESSYGTYTAPNRWYKPTGEVSWKKSKTTYQGGGVAAGRLAQPGLGRVVTNRAAAGSLPMEVSKGKMGVLLQQIFGSTPTPTLQNTSTGYLQEHSLVDNRGRFFTGQVGLPDTGGTIRPYSFLGGKIISAEFACSVSQPLMVTLECDFRDVVETETLAAVSYTVGQEQPFHFAQWTPKLGTYDSEAAVQGVRGFTFKIARPQDSERFYGGNAGLKSEPLMNDWVQVGGSVDVDFATKGDFADRYAGDTSTAMVHEFIGSSLGGAPTISETFRLRAAQVFFDEGTPNLSGPGIVTTSFNWVAQNDLTNPIAECDYISIDSAL